jgi:hypothetical protein
MAIEIREGRSHLLSGQTTKHATRSLAQVAAIMGQSMGVRVIISPDVGRGKSGGAGVNICEKTITLPELDINDPTDLAITRGLIVHEAGHLKFTKHNEGGISSRLQGVGTLMNILEDVHIEQHMKRDYPGSATALKLLCAEFITKPARDVGKMPAPKDYNNALNLFTQFILLRLRGKYTDALCKQYASKIPLPEHAKQAALAIIATEGYAPGTDDWSTANNGALARSLIIEFKQWWDHRDTSLDAQVKAQGDKKASDTPQQGRSGGQGNTSAPQGSDTPPDGPPDANSGGDSDSDGDNNDPATGGDSVADSATASPGVANEWDDTPADASVGVPGCDPFARDMTARAALSKLKQINMHGGDIGNVAHKEAENTAKTERRAGDSLTSLGYSEETLDRCHTRMHQPTENAEFDALRHSGALRKKLREFVQTQTDTNYRAASAGRLDARSYMRRSPVLDPKVFRRTDVGRDVNTHVHLLLDLSGSMGGDVLELSKGAYAIAKAIEGIPGATVAISAFIHNKFRVVKTVAQRAKFVYLGASGGTPLAEAIASAIGMAKKEPNKRRILVAMTDGEYAEKHMLNEAYQRSIASGVELVGLQLGQALSFKESLPEDVPFATVDTSAELTEAFFELTRRHIF